MRLRKRVDRPVDASGTATCDACGDAVEVLPSGRCELGHRVTSPELAASALASADAGPGPAESARSGADDSFTGAPAPPSSHVSRDTEPAPPLPPHDGIDARLGTAAPDEDTRPIPAVPVLDPEPTTSQTTVADGMLGDADLLRAADPVTEREMDASSASVDAADRWGQPAVDQEAIEPDRIEPGAPSEFGPWAEDDDMFQDLLDLDGAQPRSR